ncbi:MAG: hypothetical protein RL134_662 [Actinomycetota bacterium]
MKVRPHPISRRMAAGAVATMIVVTAHGSAQGAGLEASSSNFLQLTVLTATYRLSAVLPAQVATNMTGPLTLTLNAGNSWGQLFYVQNIGDLDVATFVLSHTGPYGNGANRVDLAYCAGGSAQGAFLSIGACAGGATLTTAVQGKGAAALSVTIPAGTTRAFQATTRVRGNGQDTTDTISVEVSTSGVITRGTATS